MGLNEYSARVEINLYLFFVDLATIVTTTVNLLHLNFIKINVEC